jgi:transcriptional regulator with XRE-family HTH domain
MARAGLKWKVKQLAAKAGISAPTIVRFEGGRATPIPATLKVIRQAFEAEGVEFPDERTVRLNAS